MIISGAFPTQICCKYTQKDKFYHYFERLQIEGSVKGSGYYYTLIAFSPTERLSVNLIQTIMFALGRKEQGICGAAMTAGACRNKISSRYMYYIQSFLLTHAF